MNLTEASTCLFCRGVGPFTTVEHTILAALGNDESFLTGQVCDSCQRYLGKEVEAFAVREPPIGPMRVLLDIRGRRGKLPTAESYCRADKCGRLPSFHPSSDAGIAFGRDDSEGTWVAIENSEMVRAFMDGSRTSFQFVFTPKHAAMLGRLIGKIALEVLCESNRAEARESRFDELRRYVRFGVSREFWVLGYKQVCDWREMKTLENVEGELNETVTCYEYSMVEVGPERLFAFMFGGQSW